MPNRKWRLASRCADAFGDEAGETIYRLITGELDPEAFDRVQTLISQCHHKPRQEDLILEAANEALAGYGVEGIMPEGAWVDSYHQNVVAAYVNLGDTYAATLLRDHERDRWLVTSWGDFVEAWELEEC